MLEDEGVAELEEAASVKAKPSSAICIHMSEDEESD